MIGMGPDSKKIGGLILALKKPQSAPEQEMDKEEMLEILAKRVIAAVKEGDAEMLLVELPKLLNNLPQPEYEQ